MTRATNTEQRQSQIISALGKIMTRHGYDGASIEAIARAAKLTPGLVHYHFKNKRSILLRLASQVMAEHRSELLAFVSGGPGHQPHRAGTGVSASPKDRLRQFIIFHLATGRTANPERTATWLLLIGEGLRDAKVRKVLEDATKELTSELASIIEEGREQGVFKTNSPSESSAALMAAIQGYFVLATLARLAIPKGSAARSVWAMAQGLLGFSGDWKAP